MGARRGLLERAPSRESPSGWTVDYPEVAPEPSPVTTIAWRLLHISDGNAIYWEHAFGPGLRNYTDLTPHGDLQPTHFGVDWPAREVFAVLIDEQVHHGAEVALLRDLYRTRFATT